MVRLKEEFNHDVGVVDYSFQFLMVRLKVPTLLRVAQVAFISIPYGSIKRFVPAEHKKSPVYFNSLWFD